MKPYKLIVFLLLCAVYAKATTYTAITSGNFSSSSTWQGGTVPPTSLLSGDNITIPLGVTVTLDQNLTINPSTTLNLSGTLTGGQGNYVLFNSGILTGSGYINVDSFSTGSTTSMTCPIALRPKILNTSTLTITNTRSPGPGNYIGAQNRLRITGGTLTISGGDFDMPATGEVIIDGGNIALTAGTVMKTGNKSFKIIYQGASTSTGAEITGNTVYDVDINVSSGNTVSMTSNMTVTGVLTLKSGTLKVNSYLLITDDLKIPSSGNGSLFCGRTSSLWIYATTDTSYVRFAPGGDTVQYFDARPDIHNVVKLMTNVNIADKLVLNGRLDIQSYHVNMLPGASVPPNGIAGHQSPQKFYIVAEKGGTLTADVPPNTTVPFSLGTYDAYLPFIILPSNTTPLNRITVGIKKGVQTNGNFGASVSSTQPVVNATWNVTSTLSTGLNLDISVGWPISMEVNSFNRNQMYISHYTGTAWDSVATSAALLDNIIGVFFAARTGITSLSPFGVFDINTKVSVEDKFTSEDAVTIYPNPTNGNTYLKVILGDATSLTALVKDITGKTVHKTPLALYSSGQTEIELPVKDLPVGTYVVSLANNNGKILWSGKLLRQ